MDSATAVGGESVNGIIEIQSTIEGMPVTRIAPYAFAGGMRQDGEVEERSDIVEVRMMPGIETVGERAFYYCSLTSVHLADTVKDICDEAFRGCRSLSSVDLESVRFVGFEAFRDCHSLKHLAIPETVVYCGDGAFYLCTGLKDASTGIPSIPARLFGYCTGLERIALKNTEDVGDAAFYRCGSLENVNLGDVRKIGRDAFRDCESLIDVHMREVKTIEGAAFRGCISLNSITLPATLSSLGGYAFADCMQLREIHANGPCPQGDDTVFLNVDARIICAEEHMESWAGSDFGLDVHVSEASLTGIIPHLVTILFVSVLLTVCAFICRNRNRRYVV